jgi:hypothetical protein
MHIVLMAWLYVTLAMALTMDTLLGGIALFGLIGLAPVLLVAMLAARRLRMQRRQQRTPQPPPGRR